MIKEISLVVAFNKNKGIGKNGNLIYNISDDLKHFKKITSGYPIIMGRKTFESLPNGPLPNRLNIIISKKYITDSNINNNILVFDNIGSAISYVNEKGYEKVFFIGGGQIYKEVMELGWVTSMYITYIDDDEDADTFFPNFNVNDWEMVENIENIDPKTGLKFYFQKFSKKI